MMSEYEKKEIYQYDKQITLEEKRREGIKEGMKKGIEKGRLEEQISMATAMKKENIDIETIKRITGLTIKEIEKL